MKRFLMAASLAVLATVGLVGSAWAQVNNIVPILGQEVHFRFLRGTVSGALDSTTVTTFNQTAVATDTTNWVGFWDQYYTVGNSWWNGGTLGNTADTTFAYQIVVASANGAAVTGADSVDVTIQTSVDGWTVASADTLDAGLGVARMVLTTNPEAARTYYTTYGGIGTDRINWSNVRWIRFLLRLDPNTVGATWRIYLRRYALRSNSNSPYVGY